jgi:hypothetical protein
VMAVSSENQGQVCYLGHENCWDRHDAERRTDEADWEADRECDELAHIERMIGWPNGR